MGRKGEGTCEWSLVSDDEMSEEAGDEGLIKVGSGSGLGASISGKGERNESSLMLSVSPSDDEGGVLKRTRRDAPSGT